MASLLGSSSCLPTAGGTSTHQLVNSSLTPIVFKAYIPINDGVATAMSVASNDLYSVEPVYAFVPPQSSVAINVFGPANPSKNEKIVVQCARVHANASDPQGSYETIVKEKKILSYCELVLNALYVNPANFYATSLRFKELYLCSKHSELYHVALQKNDMMDYEVGKCEVKDGMDLMVKCRYKGEHDGRTTMEFWYGSAVINPGASCISDPDAVIKDLCLWEKFDVSVDCSVKKLY